MEGGTGRGRPEAGPRPRARRLPSLTELEGVGLVRGARWWARLTVVAGAACGLVAATALPVDTGPLVALVLGTTLLLLVLSTPRFTRTWDLTAGTIGTVAVLVAAGLSGGTASPLRHLVLLPVVYVAAAHGRRQVVWLLLLVAVGLGWLLLADGATVAAAVEILVLLVIAGVVAAAAVALRASLRRASARLTRATELHRALVESHTDVVHLLDLEGRWLEANRRVEELTGHRPADLLGRSSLELIAPAVRERTQRHFELAVSGAPQTFETAVLRADGSELPLLVTNVRIALGPERSAVLGIATDLRDTVRERSARQTLERRFQRLAETAKDGIYILRTAGAERRFVYVNPAMTELTGVTAEDWYRDPDVGEQHVEADELARIRERHPRGEPYREPVVVHWSHPEAGERWLEFREVPWEDEDGEVVGVQGLVHDVTEVVRQRTAVETALQREQAAVEHLRRLDDMKNAFLQSVSHELRTPLTSVIGLADTLANRFDDLHPEQARMLLSRTVANARKLERLLADLLDVDRLSRGVLAPNLAPVDVARLAAAVLDEAEDLGGRVIADLQPVVVPADGPKLERVIENLLHNAVRHTADDTPVWLRVAPADGGAEIVVEDAGTGIEPELVGVLFEPFTQGAASARAAKPGTGIGLSLVARFTELHGGGVEVGERPGGGARFRVWLPADHGA